MVLYDRTESASQLRWFLEDYATSSSARTAKVPDNTWGGRGIIGMAAIFLRRTVYVVQQLDVKPQEWRCVKHVPTTVTRHHRVVETASEYQMSIADLMDEVTALKKDTPDHPPLLLQFREKHYSAFIHSGRMSQLPDFDSEEDNPGVPGHDRAVVQLRTAITTPNTEEVFEASTQRNCVDVTASDRSAKAGQGASCMVETGPTSALVVMERQMILPPTSTTPPAGIRKAPPADRKRGHAVSSEGSVTLGTMVTYQNNDSVLKKGRIDPMEQMLSTDTEVPDRIDRDDLAAAWEILEPEWPNPKQIPFPTVNSQTSEWKRVASLAPDHLLWLVKRFMFPGELLQTLDDTIIETWMSGSRRDCVEDGLQRFRKQPLDRPTQVWIDQWVLKTQHRPDHSMLAPVMDNADDWRLLRARNYAGDDLLKLCDPQRRSRLSHHLLCALLYDHEIAALVEGTPSATSVSSKVRSHFKLITTNAGYKQAYYTPNKRGDWAAIERFFYTGLARPEEKLLLQY